MRIPCACRSVVRRRCRLHALQRHAVLARTRGAVRCGLPRIPGPHRMRPRALLPHAPSRGQARHGEGGSLRRQLPRAQARARRLRRAPRRARAGDHRPLAARGQGHRGLDAHREHQGREGAVLPGRPRLREVHRRHVHAACEGEAGVHPDRRRRTRLFPRRRMLLPAPRGGVQRTAGYGVFGEDAAREGVRRAAGRSRLHDVPRRPARHDEPSRETLPHGDRRRGSVHPRRHLRGRRGDVPRAADGARHRREGTEAGDARVDRQLHGAVRHASAGERHAHARVRGILPRLRHRHPRRGGHLSAQPLEQVGAVVLHAPGGGVVPGLHGREDVVCERTQGPDARLARVHRRAGAEPRSSRRTRPRGRRGVRCGGRRGAVFLTLPEMARRVEPRRDVHQPRHVRRAGVHPVRNPVPRGEGLHARRRVRGVAPGRGRPFHRCRACAGVLAQGARDGGGGAGAHQTRPPGPHWSHGRDEGFPLQPRA